MADATILLDQSGPLPVSANFNAPSDGPVIFVLTGTAWTATAGQLIGINLYLDGNAIGNASMCFSNEDTSHKTLRPTFIPYDGLTAGPHTIQVVPAFTSTVTDLNDYFQVTLLY